MSKEKEAETEALSPEDMQRQIRRGIICIILSAFSFSLMNLFIRLAGDVPTMQKCFFRNIVAVVIAFVSMMKTHATFRPKKGSAPMILIRAIFGTTGLMCNFYAIDHMNISDASILNKLSPFFAMVFSVIILKEVANLWEWLALAVAFGGALFVVKPSFSPDVAPALIALAGGCGAGFAYTFLRKLGTRGENGMLIVFYFSAFSTLVTLPFLIFDFHPMTWQQWVFLFLTGVGAAGGQIFITKAYRYAPAKEISVYDYTSVVFSAIWGGLFLSQVPDAWSILGYVIIIGTAAVKWYLTSDRKRGKKA